LNSASSSQRSSALDEGEISLQPLGEICRDASLDDVAGMFEVGDKGENFRQPTIIVGIEGFGIQRGQVSFDRAVEPIEHIIEPLDLSDTLAVTTIEPVQRGAQHGFENIGHAQCLA
jgi:hypothetical protein